MKIAEHFNHIPEPGAGFDIVEVPLDGRALVLEVHGELDIATAPLLRERLASVVERDLELVVVDLKAVDFLDSVSLAVLLRAHAALGRGGRMVVVVAPGSYARLIFDVTGVDQRLHVVASRDEALAGRASLN